MNANDFVEALADIAPSENEYLRDGFSKEDARELRKNYHRSKRDGELAISSSDELLVLMSIWNTRDLEIGMVALRDKPVRTKRGLQVGVFDADSLLMLDSTGELVVEKYGHQCHRVAASGERFLDALIVAGRFLESAEVDDITKATSTADECATLAGGPDYYGFYAMLLVDEE